MTRRSNLPLVGALVVSVLGAGVTRPLVLRQRQKLDEQRHTVATAKADLSKVNSFALGLLLGGLRGPLVMALWTTSESQKTDRDLDDFDTKVELIRLLQPEFDTVHLFQIWNKAYNVSVQMANVPNKYTTILDALAYGFSVDRERPDNINILASIANLYFDKFGGASEKQYFSARLKSETLAPEERVRVEFNAADRDTVTREARLGGAATFELGTYEANDDGTRLYLTLNKITADALRSRLNVAGVDYAPRPMTGTERRDAAGRPTQHAALLDAKGMLLPKFARGNAATRPAAGVADEPLKYLVEFQPFPYGVSPYALAYDYYKHCVWLQDNRNSQHAQLSPRVLSSRCPMSLEKWSEETWYGTLRSEIDLAGRPVPGDDGALNGVTADLLVGTGLPAGPLFEQAVYGFTQTAALCRRAMAEYETHIKKFREDELTFRSHVFDLEARGHMTAAEALFLRTTHATGGERSSLARQAAAEYQTAANLYIRNLFRYYVDEEDAKDSLPRDVRNLKRVDMNDPVNGVRDDELAGSMARMRAKHQAAGYRLGNSQDFSEVDSYVLRAYARIRALAVVQ